MSKVDKKIDEGLGSELITYSEYSFYSRSPLDSSIFSKLRPRATLKFHYLTDNRVKDLEVIPEEVKLTLTEFIDAINAVQGEDGSISISNLTSYSNGIESFGFQTPDSANPEKCLNQLLYSIAETTLSTMPELLYRGSLRKRR